MSIQICENHDFLVVYEYGYGRGSVTSCPVCAIFAEKEEEIAELKAEAEAEK